MPFTPEQAAEELRNLRRGESKAIAIMCLPEGREAEELSRLCGFRVRVTLHNQVEMTVTRG